MLEAFQFKVRAITNKIQVKCSNIKEEFLTKTHELIMKLGECSKNERIAGAEIRDLVPGHGSLCGEPSQRKGELIAEIADLFSDKPEVSNYNKKEEMKGFDLCLSKMSAGA